MNNYLESASIELLASLSRIWSLFVKQIPALVLAILIVALGIFLSIQLSNLFRRSIASRVTDQIMIHFLSKTIKFLFSTIFIMYALKVAGLEGIAAGILAAAGASTLIIGFAFRDIGENFISGIILSFNRPFNINDTVRIGEIFGKIRNIEFRYTKIKTFDGRDVYIPNSDVIKKPVYNYTEDGFYRFDFIVGIGYENDISSAEKLIIQRLEKLDDVYEDDSHKTFVYVDALAASTVNLKVHFWIKTEEYGSEALLKKGKVVSEIKSALLTEGFNLPANINEIKLYDTQKIIPMSLDGLMGDKSKANYLA